MADLRIDSAESFPVSLGTPFSNNINIKIAADPLFNDFGDNNVVFLFFSNLKGGSRLSLRAIYYIPDFFFFEDDLREISPLRLLLVVSKLLFLALLFVIFICYCGNIEE